MRGDVRLSATNGSARGPLRATEIARNQRHRRPRPCPCECGQIGLCDAHKARLAEVREVLQEEVDRTGIYGKRNGKRKAGRGVREREEVNFGYGDD